MLPKTKVNGPGRAGIYSIYQHFSLFCLLSGDGLLFRVFLFHILLSIINIFHLSKIYCVVRPSNTIIFFLCHASLCQNPYSRFKVSKSPKYVSKLFQRCDEQARKTNRSIKGYRMMSAPFPSLSNPALPFACVRKGDLNITPLLLSFDLPYSPFLSLGKMEWN